MARPWQQRTELILGPEGLARLAAARVLVVGLGGVGAMAAEMLVRAGVGRITLVDSDSVAESNINRQLPALHSTVGRSKADVVGERLMDINPALELRLIKEFVHEDSIPSLLLPEYDYVVDAIDTLSPKIALIQWCLANRLPLVSSMGSGAKTDGTRVRIRSEEHTSELQSLY